MERENYQDLQIWLQDYVGYAPNAEILAEAQEQMKDQEIYLPEIYDLLENGQVIWADRDEFGCLFTVTGRNCDEEEITVNGRFQSATLLVVIEQITRTR